MTSLSALYPSGNTLDTDTSAVHVSFDSRIAFLCHKILPERQATKTKTSCVMTSILSSGERDEVLEDRL